MTAQRLQAKRQSQLAARMLLTKVLPAQRPLRVLITSVGPGEGRTTLADALVEELHLAATMNSDTTASDVVVVDGPPYLGPSSRSLSPRDLMEIGRVSRHRAPAIVPAIVVARTAGLAEIVRNRGSSRRLERFPTAHRPVRDPMEPATR